jgi:hypothetical protein
MNDDALRKLVDEATPGPWTHIKTLVYVGEPDTFDAHGNSDWGGFDIQNCPRPEANARLIALAPTLAREVLALREAAREVYETHMLTAGGSPEAWAKHWVALATLRTVLGESE